MKNIIAISFLFFWTTFANANEIDNLKTISDVRQFVTKLDSSYSHYKVTTFFKSDIDNSGSTDLLVNGDLALAILDIDNGHYRIYGISDGERHYEILNDFYVKNVPLLLVNSWVDCRGNKDNIKTDTLVFKFNSFLKYNSNPGKLCIKEIKLSADNGWGSQVFQLRISTDGSITYMKHVYKWQTSTGKIDPISLEDIIQIINYIDLVSLNDSYPSKGFDCITSDEPTYELEVEFNTGQLKKIRSYSLIGPVGLKNLYQQLINAGEKLKN